MEKQAKEGWLTEALSEISNMDILNEFDVPRRKISTRVSILCPDSAHDDKHFGSCFLMKNGNGYHCFACGKTAGKFTMLQQVSGMSKSDALKWIAKRTGYSLDQKERKRETEEIARVRKFIADVEAYVENQPAFGVVNACDKNESSGRSDKEGTYLKIKTIASSPLKDLYKEDKKAFKTIVENVLNDREQEYVELVKTCFYPEPEYAWDSLFGPVDDYSRFDDIVEGAHQHIQNIRKLKKELETL